MLVPRYGMGDDTTGAVATNPLDVLSNMTLGSITGQVPGFLTQQVGPLPMWAWAGAAFLVSYWLFFPSGSEYRRKKRELKAEHTGVARIRRRGRRARSGLKQVVS